MFVHYLLSFGFEGVEETQVNEIKYSLLSGLKQGAVTSSFTYYLPNTVGFVSHLESSLIASILDRVNNEVFPAGRTMRYFLAEVNPQTLHINVNSEEENMFQQEMARR